jgi:Mn-dependent DtxR family transcriptional regulator
MENKTKTVIETFEKSNAPLKTGEIAQKTGIDSKEVSKIIKKLKTDGIIESPKRCYYSLKK